jgi:tetratricopeptide (TPR) repeat protein
VANRPSTLPGMVTYPDRPDKGRPNLPGYGGNRPTTLPGEIANRPNLPGVGGGTGQRPNLPDRPGGDNRPSIVDRGDINVSNRPVQIGGGNQVNVGNVNVGGRNQSLNRPATRPVERRDWDANRWGGNNSVWGNNVNISGNNVNVRVNNNFRYNNNFACRPNYWGARPWWGSANYHVWHHGHWGYGWNSGYYHRHWWFDDDNDFAAGFMWGIGVWSLGNLIYDMGYHSYQNPYPAPVVQNTYVTYTQPISVAAAANPPGDEAVAAAAEEKSDDALARSRTAFAAGDYLAASAAADEAIAANPGDVTLHEFRSLVLFALGKYGDAAGVLNPVLASGPGWSWETMSGFYGDTGAYNTQLAKLEAYTKASPEAAYAHFLLGYHYLVCGHMANASVEFGAASKLQPADSISRQLAALTADSVPDAGDGAVGAAPVTRPDPVPAEKLVGSWSTDSAAGKILFTMNPGGDFSWSCTGTENTSVMKGTYGLNDKGLLVLSTDDSQLVSAVSMEGEGKMKFILVGAPDGDPGLEFTKG